MMRKRFRRNKNRLGINFRNFGIFKKHIIDLSLGDGAHINDNNNCLLREYAKKDEDIYSNHSSDSKSVKTVYGTVEEDCLDDKLESAEETINDASELKRTDSQYCTFQFYDDVEKFAEQTKPNFFVHLIVVILALAVTVPLIYMYLMLETTEETRMTKFYDYLEELFTMDYNSVFAQEEEDYYFNY
ncbi:hypothetical protein SNEBB_007861 [Seison nebaliae]|nr:hypothetical protein SNEBB_007861 [Seison nebaliae]